MPFCATPAAVAAFKRWRARLEAASVQLGEPDAYVVGLVASREARLEELSGELARCKRPERRLRLLQQERLAAADMQKALDLLDRTYGGAATEAAAPVRATGTGGRVVAFPQRGLGPMAQRIVAAADKGVALTKAQLRERIRGSQGDFLRGLREALAVGALARGGAGSRTRPYVYRRVS
jgi:hypothetical protein